MRLPKIGYTPEKAQREMVAMRGINWSDRVQDGDLRDSGNLSFRRWPYLTTRRGRAKQSGYTGVSALTAHGKLAVVRGKDLLYDGKKVGTLTAGAKQFAAVNSKLVIWPDKVYLDLESKTVKPLGAKLTLSARSCTFTENGMRTDARPVLVEHREDKFTAERLNDYPYMRRVSTIARNAAGAWVYTGLATVSIEALKVGDIVLMDKSGEQLNHSWGDPFTTDHPDRYAVITGRQEEWDGYHDGYHFSASYQIVYCPPLNENLRNIFQVGDSVTLTGAGGNSRESVVIKTLSGSTATFEGANFTPGDYTGAVTIERKIPKLSFICESQNRLWGCEGHTIYASALGDPTNFFLYSGLSTDSYAVAVGTDGDFTGCIGYSEGVLFWKEDCLHKVLGTYPANYELHTYSIPGLQAGSEKSMAIISDLLFYKGERGVYAYGGGTPSLLSECFGQREFTQAVGGTDGERYYLSVKEGNAGHLLVYDPKAGMWLREDDVRARDFARLGNRLYFADANGNVWLVDGGAEDPEQEWTAQFAPFYETVLGRKRYSRLLLRLELPEGSWVRAELRLDNGPWNECGKVVGRTEDVVPMRLGVNRCDKLELRLRGKGLCTVLSVLREFTVGSER